MTNEERKLALYCLKASSDYHSEICEECIKYGNCDHTQQDDVTETIIKALEQGPKKGHWIEHPHEWGDNWQYSQYECSCCHNWAYHDTDYCPNCGAEMESD